jgi:hypothetical protein
MDDIRITICDNLSVSIYDFNRENEVILTLIDTVERYFKNKRIKVREIVIDKSDLTQSQINLISLLKQQNTIVHSKVPLDNTSSDDIFEAQILIPYRSKHPNTFRQQQLHKFLQHMNDYLSIVHPKLIYKLVIIEQHNDHMFNRGLLLNVGFLEREKDIDYKIKYYIHHNCDLFPNIEQTPQLDYSFTPVNEVRDIFGYSGGIGGIAIFNRLTFSQIQGFPNDYFNWGAEDSTLHKRCERNSIDIKRPLYNVGVHEESHARDSSYNDINSRKGERDSPNTNGLQTCKYKCEININSEFKYDNVIHYLADFDYN